jgi:serine/threonine protein phosphatase 1
MFGRWFKGPSNVRLGNISPGLAVYAVGDIHGRLDLLEDLLRRIREDAGHYAGDTERILVFLGDYIDRGPASRGVVDRLLEGPLDGFVTVRLMGNHEEALLSFLDGISDGLDWLSFGGLETMLSYDIPPLRALPNTSQQVTELRQALAEALPKAHLDFFRHCAHRHSIGDYVFVHAGVRPGVTLDKQTSSDLMWIRDDFLRVRVPLPGRVVVHGHTIVDLPQDRTNRINLDTGAFVSGRLSCLALRGKERRFISTLDG